MYICPTRLHVQTVGSGTYRICAASTIKTHMLTHPGKLEVYILVWAFNSIHTLCIKEAKVLASLRICTDSLETSLLGVAISTDISCTGPYYNVLFVMEGKVWWRGRCVWRNWADTHESARYLYYKFYSCVWCGERSGSVVECLTRVRGTEGSSLTGVTALWSLSKTQLS